MTSGVRFPKFELSPSLCLPLPSISLPKLELNVESGSFSSDDSVRDLANPSVLAPADPAPSLKVSAQEGNA